MQRTYWNHADTWLFAFEGAITKCDGGSRQQRGDMRIVHPALVQVRQFPVASRSFASVDGCHWQPDLAVISPVAWRGEYEIHRSQEAQKWPRAPPIG